MAHERRARDEAIQRADGERQVVEQALQRERDELAIERASRQKAEQERDEAVARRQEAEERLRKTLVIQDDLKASQAVPRSTDDPQATRRPRRSTLTTEPSAGLEQPRRHGRPAKSGQSEEDIVE